MKEIFLEKFEYFIKEIHPSDFFNSELEILLNLKKKFKDLNRWYDEISSRDAVKRGYDLLKKGDLIPKA